ncbi:c-type cytochrome [Galenea microaerophila]
MKKSVLLKTFNPVLLGAIVTLGLVGCSGSNNQSEPAQSTHSSADSVEKKEAPKATQETQKIQQSHSAPRELVTPAQSQATQQSTADVKQPMAEASATPENPGKKIYDSTCVGCHGVTAEGGVGPKLRGKSKVDLVQKLKGYRDGQQFGPMTSMMAPNVANFSDQQIEEVAEYLAKM